MQLQVTGDATIIPTHASFMEERNFGAATLAAVEQQGDGLLGCFTLQALISVRRRRLMVFEPILIWLSVPILCFWPCWVYIGALEDRVGAHKAPITKERDPSRLVPPCKVSLYAYNKAGVFESMFGWCGRLIAFPWLLPCAYSSNGVFGFLVVSALMPLDFTLLLWQLKQSTFGWCDTLIACPSLLPFANGDSIGICHPYRYQCGLRFQWL